MKEASPETAFTEPTPTASNEPASPVVNAMRRLVDRLSNPFYFYKINFELFHEKTTFLSILQNKKNAFHFELEHKFEILAIKNNFNGQPDL